MIHPVKLAHSSAKHRCGKRKFYYRGINLIDQNGQKPTIYISSTIRISIIAGYEEIRMPATKRSSKKQSSSRARTRSTSKGGNKRWVAGVKTVSTFPPKGLFTKDAPTIAKSLASKKVSPKGPGSGMRMLTYFINRGGRGLSPSRRRVLERAKQILTQRMERQKRHERPRTD
jgi:Protein of unknown function (DUF3175)